MDVQLNDASGEDRLLGRFSSPIRVHASHTQSVLRLPKGARLLAHNETDANQAFVLRDCAWGVQFHPEFDAGIVARYISHYSEELIREGKDPKQLARDCTDTSYGTEILRRFAQSY